MAEEIKNKSHEYEATKVGDEGSVETKDRGLFDFLKKDEKTQEEAVSSEFAEKVKVSEEPKHKEEVHKEEEKKSSLLEKLRRSDSSSSSVSHVLTVVSHFYDRFMKIA